MDMLAPLMPDVDFATELQEFSPEAIELRIMATPLGVRRGEDETPGRRLFLPQAPRRRDARQTRERRDDPYPHRVMRAD